MKQSKPKKVNYQIIPAQSEFGKPIYTMLRDLVERQHESLRDARIVLGWHVGGWKPDVDGNVTLGMTQKASDLHRELAAYDFVILLNRPLWLDELFDDYKREALLDHLLCFADVTLDKHLEPVEDERGRKVYRRRRENVRGFRENIDRYGVWTNELEELAKVLAKSRPERVEKQARLRVSECQECGGTTYVDVVVAGVSRVARCACFTEAQAIRAKAMEAPATIQ